MAPKGILQKEFLEVFNKKKDRRQNVPSCPPLDLVWESITWICSHSIAVLRRKSKCSWRNSLRSLTSPGTRHLNEWNPEPPASTPLVSENQKFHILVGYSAICPYIDLLLYSKDMHKLWLKRKISIYLAHGSDGFVGSAGWFWEKGKVIDLSYTAVIWGLGLGSFWRYFCFCIWPQGSKTQQLGVSRAEASHASPHFSLPPSPSISLSLSLVASELSGQISYMVS